MNHSLSSLIVFIILWVFLAGCVSQKKYRELEASYKQVQQRTRDVNTQYQDCQSQLASSKSRVSSLEDQLAAERSNLAGLQSALDKCLNSTSQGNTNISKLVDEIKASNQYIQHLVNAKNKSDSLNMILTNNLTRSLSREELKDVDVQVLKGVVYISLSDDMLYKSGDYNISESAGTILSKIAKIIKDYKNYDVLIEGNTDNVPIQRSNIRNNWDLSALRASSVVQSLQQQHGVDPSRMTAGGRGEYNPVASNDTETGRSKNRRTQIIVTPKLDEFMELIEKAPGEEKK